MLQMHDEFMRLRKPRGLFDFLLARTWITIRDIFPNGSMKEERLLRHYGDLFAQTLLRHLGNILSVDRYRAAREIVVMQEEAHERGFARAASPYKPHALFRPDVNRETAKHFVTAVGKRHIVDIDRAARNAEHFCALSIGNLMRLDDLFETLADFAPRLGKFIEIRTERLQEALDAEDNGEDQNDIAERYERLSREPDNSEYHCHTEDDQEHAVDDARPLAKVPTHKVRVPPPLRHAAQSFRLVFAARVFLHRGNVGEEIDCRSVDFGFHIVRFYRKRHSLEPQVRIDAKNEAYPDKKYPSNEMIHAECNDETHDHVDRKLKEFPEKHVDHLAHSARGIPNFVHDRACKTLRKT